MLLESNKVVWKVLTTAAQKAVLKAAVTAAWLAFCSAASLVGSMVSIPAVDLERQTAETQVELMAAPKAATWAD